PLGVGILTTAQKQKKLRPEHEFLARDVMCQMNTIGAQVAHLTGVEAITDVTGFGLMGHLLEVCEGSGVNAVLHEQQIPLLEPVREYIAQGCVPGGTTRNFESYGAKLAPLTDEQRALLCDPQTSGGLLIAVQPEHAAGVEQLLSAAGLYAQSIGELVEARADYRIEVRS
ncbi:MAG: selenide, water dikinase SelD, partial [Gammaproteobacteria bacterium]|nr:selenide, water dikinase SelD [Gammaproteobacteria bacterium]